MKQSPVFARTHDLLFWLIPQTMKFPRSQRFVLAKRVQDAALDFQEHLLEAGLSKESVRIERMDQADVALAKLRSYLRLCHEMQLLSLGQYEHVSRMVAEVGRLLGGWYQSETDTAE
jgi:cytosine/adenosine deaminase-related metal-dependent hydrolase